MRKQLSKQTTVRATSGQRWNLPGRRPEQDLQRAVVAHLEMRGVKRLFFTHFPAGGVRSSVEAGIFRGLGLKAGVPDLLIWHGGRCYGLELKADTKGARVSPAQIETQGMMREAGVIVRTAYGLDAALEWLEDHGLLRGVTQLRARCPEFRLQKDVERFSVCPGAARPDPKNAQEGRF